MALVVGDGQENSSAKLGTELSAAFRELSLALEVDLVKMGDVFDRLYSKFPKQIGKKVSRKEREEKSYHSPTLVYGDIEFGPFVDMLLRCRKYGAMTKPGGKFVDLGCGSGRPVFAAALVHEWETLQGIEILDGLYHLCLETLEVWEEDSVPRLPAKAQESFRNFTDISFIHGDATALSWEDADVVFANSTCFDADLMHKLALKGSFMKAGSMFLTTTKPLPGEDFDLMEVAKMVEGWGDATVFLHRRKPHPGSLHSGASLTVASNDGAAPGAAEVEEAK